jgi:hypothetical protein
VGPLDRPVHETAAAIGGTVAAADGSPVAWANVLIIGDSPTHRDVAAVTDARGTFRFDGLAPGSYTLLVNAPGVPPQTGKVDAVLGTLARLDFDLP